MNRNLHVERLYSLGDYKNIKFSDTINDLPLDLTLNTELLSAIRYLQMISMEKALRNYLELKEKLGKLGPEQELEYLEEQEFNTLKLIKSIMNGNLKGE